MTIPNPMILLPNLPFAVKEIIDIRDKLPKNPKGDWLHLPTKRKDGEFATGPRDIEDIQLISIHHTAVEGGTAEGHARYHISKGYGSLAYHVYIKGDQIHYANDFSALTWHTGNNNFFTVGIAVEGNFAKRNLTEGERSALYAAILTVMSMFNIPVSRVLGHKEFKQPTTCPAFDMDKVRADLTSIIEQMQYNESPNRAREEIFASVTRVNDLYAKYINKEGKYSESVQREAERKLLVLYPSLKEKQFI